MSDPVHDGVQEPQDGPIPEGDVQVPFREMNIFMNHVLRISEMQFHLNLDELLDSYLTLNFCVCLTFNFYMYIEL